MTEEELAEANKIKEELAELKSFLFYAERVWTGKLTLKKIISSAFGMFESQEFKMTTDTKNKVLTVLQDHKTSLEHRLSEL